MTTASGPSRPLGSSSPCSFRLTNLLTNGLGSSSISSIALCARASLIRSGISNSSRRVLRRWSS